MEDELRVLFSSDEEDENCCNLMVSRKDPDGVEDILASIDGKLARSIYDVLTDYDKERRTMDKKYKVDKIDGGVYHRYGSNFTFEEAYDFVLSIVSKEDLRSSIKFGNDDGTNTIYMMRDCTIGVFEVENDKERRTDMMQQEMVERIEKLEKENRVLKDCLNRTLDLVSKNTNCILDLKQQVEILKIIAK